MYANPRDSRIVGVESATVADHLETLWVQAALRDIDLDITFADGKYKLVDRRTGRTIFHGDDHGAAKVVIDMHALDCRPDKQRPRKPR